MERNIEGLTFGILKVIAKDRHLGKEWSYFCVCECGIKKSMRKGNIVRAGSCGCIRENKRELLARTHGQSSSKSYKIWESMLQRCNNPNNKSYLRYGARGIKPSKEWENFENFFADMGEPPPGMELERKDNNGPYSITNCRWATKKEQNRNKETTLLVTYKNKSVSLSEVAEIENVNYKDLWYRIRKTNMDLMSAIELLRGKK